LSKKPNKTPKPNKTQKTHWVGLFLKKNGFLNPGFYCLTGVYINAQGNSLAYSG